MSEFYASLNDLEHLHLADHNQPTIDFSWKKNSVKFTQIGLRVYTNVEIDTKTQEMFVSTLAKLDPSLPPHWQALPPELHRPATKIINSIRGAAFEVYAALRKNPKCLRLPPLEFGRRFINQSQSFPVVFWSFNVEEKERLKELLEKTVTNKSHLTRYKNGLNIPVCEAFERKQIFLETDEVMDIGKSLESNEQITESYTALYSTALENLVFGSLDSSILILATSIEVALKQYLSNSGDEIANYLIKELQSPPLEKLFICGQKKCQLNCPGIFADWLTDLRVTRNKIAHRASKIDVPSLKIVRWFAVAETILNGISGLPVEPLAGQLVEPFGDKAPENFPQDTKGIILRREPYLEMGSLHVVIDTGETWRFSENSFRACSNQEIL